MNLINPKWYQIADPWRICVEGLDAGYWMATARAGWGYTA